MTDIISSTIFFIIISKSRIIKDHKVNKFIFIDEKNGLLLRIWYNSVCSNRSRSTVIGKRFLCRTIYETCFSKISGV